jgi:hypothetical protein
MACIVYSWYCIHAWMYVWVNGSLGRGAGGGARARPSNQRAAARRAGGGKSGGHYTPRL